MESMEGEVKMQVRAIILLVFSLIIAVFAVMNTQPVNINFIFGNAEVQLILIILISLLLGAIFMFILASMKQIKLTRQIKQLEKENQGFIQEIEQFKLSKEESVSENNHDETTQSTETDSDSEQKD